MTSERSEYRKRVIVKIIPQVRFEVQDMNGTSLGEFTKESEWEGLVKLVSNKSPHSVLTVIDSSFIEKFLSFDKENEREAEVLTMSQDLHKHFSSKEEDKNGTT